MFQIWITFEYFTTVPGISQRTVNKVPLGHIFEAFQNLIQQYRYMWTLHAIPFVIKAL